MKVLIINGSPRQNGNTSIAVREMENFFKASGVDVETVQIGSKNIRGCIACNRCATTGKCAFDDVVNELAEKFERALPHRLKKLPHIPLTKHLKNLSLLDIMRLMKLFIRICKC